jgi:hypothetical protein
MSDSRAGGARPWGSHTRQNPAATVSFRVAPWPYGVFVNYVDGMNNVVSHDEAGVKVYCCFWRRWSWNRVNDFGWFGVIAGYYTQDFLLLTGSEYHRAAREACIINAV